jgi:hypothetical protein
VKRIKPQVTSLRDLVEGDVVAESGELFDPTFIS